MHIKSISILFSFASNCILNALKYEKHLKKVNVSLQLQILIISRICIDYKTSRIHIYLFFYDATNI